jgi:alpha-N-arabinofuranosidase
LPQVPFLKLAAVHDEPARTLTLFALNRSLTDEMPLRVTVEGFSGLEVEQGFQLCDSDLKATNTRTQPERVRPSALTTVRAYGSDLRGILQPASWNVMRVRVGQ